ncbi:MAG: hypothetical protein AAF004_11990 [Pseudomonadota bacterium]
MSQKNHMSSARVGAVVSSLCVLALLPVCGAAQTITDISQCRSLENTAERLACYDAIAEPPAAPATPSATELPATPTPASVAVPERAPVLTETEAQAPSPVADAMPPSTQPAKPPAASTPDMISDEPIPAAPEPVVTAPAPADEDAFGSEQVESKRGPKRLESRIVGDFDGWWGDTVFRLENGQVWVQAEFGKKRYKGPANPEVLILRKSFGSYRLKMAHTNKTLRVKRIK